MKKVTSLVLAIIMTASLFAAFSQVGAISTTPEFDQNAGLVLVESGASILSSHNVAKLAKDNGTDALAVVGAKDNTVSFKISATVLADMAKAGMKINVITQNATMVFDNALVKELSEKIKQEFAFSADTSTGIKATFLGDNAPITLENGVSVIGFDCKSNYISLQTAEGQVPFFHADGTKWATVAKEDIDAEITSIAPGTFKDVADNFWGKAAVDYVTSRGFFNGTGEGVFSPDAKMTRAMVVTVLSRIDGYNSDNITYTYTDTNKNAWFAKGVNWAFENGIVAGGDSFRPDEDVTRIELMDMLYRFALKLGITEEVTEANLSGFMDASRVTEAELIKAASYCTGNGIVTGKASGNKIALAPVMAATRAEVATMIQRFMNNALLGSKLITTNGQYKDFITVRGDLNNTYHKLMSGERTIVSYFGGSVTYGVGATNHDVHSWRARTFNWLKENFPEASILQNQKGSGGTGSHLGAFREQLDIIDRETDLLFIEFAMNDTYGGTQKDGKTGLYFEQVIRQAREKLPECDIVALYSIDQNFSETLSPTEFYPAAKEQEAVCEKYGVTSIYVGGALNRTLKGLEGGVKANWSSYVRDIVHPLDKGYQLYADVVIEYLREYLLGVPTYTYGEVKEYIVPDTYVDERNATMDPEFVLIPSLDIFESHKNIELNKSDAMGGTSIIGAIFATNPDNEFTLKFNGTGIDIVTVSNYYLFYSIDGGKVKEVMTTDNHPFRLVHGLKPGEHTITFSIKGATKTGGNLKPEHHIRAFLIEGTK